MSTVLPKRKNGEETSCYLPKFEARNSVAEANTESESLSTRAVPRLPKIGRGEGARHKRENASSHHTSVAAACATSNVLVPMKTTLCEKIIAARDKLQCEEYHHKSVSDGRTPSERVPILLFLIPGDKANRSNNLNRYHEIRYSDTPKQNTWPSIKQERVGGRKYKINPKVFPRVYFIHTPSSHHYTFAGSLTNATQAQPAPKGDCHTRNRPHTSTRAFCSTRTKKKFPPPPGRLLHRASRASIQLTTQQLFVFLACL